jgi:hypothetical protein
MAKSVKSKAEEQFAATQKKAKQFLKEKDKAWQELMDRVAEQAALHLAKQAADKEAAEKAAVKNKKPSRLSQAHGRLS